MLKVPNKQTERVLKLAEFFDALDPKRYRQTRYADGDVHCICGWVNTQAGYPACDEERGCELLGITREQGRKLFAGGAGKRHSMWSTTEYPPTPQDAARVLRHLAVTGEIPAYWNATNTEEVQLCEVA